MEIKADPKLPHHYIIAVSVYPATHNKAGQFYMKYRPVYFNHDDIEKMQYASILVKDKLFKTTNEEALKIINKQELALTISSLTIAAEANQCTLHHFSSEFKMEESDFENIVKLANISDEFKKILKNSSMRGI